MFTTSVFEKEVESVVDVGGGGACIEVEEEEGQPRIGLLDTFLYSLGDDMVSDTAEGLYRHHFLHARLRQRTNLPGQKPAFAEVRRGVDDLLREAANREDVLEVAIEGEVRT